MTHDDSGAQESSSPAGLPVSAFVRGAALAVAVGLVLLIAWLAVSGLIAYRAAEALQDDALGIEQSARDGDLDAVASALRSAAGHADRADAMLSTPPWRWMQAAPAVGESVRSVSLLAAATAQTLDPVAEAGTLLAERFARGRPDGFGATAAALEVVSSPLARAADAAADHLPAVEAINADAVMGPLAEPVSRGQQEFAAIAEGLAAASAAASALPDLVGVSGTTRWVLAPGQPAEARGTASGFTGAFAVVTARDGRLSIGQAVPNDVIFSRPLDISAFPADSQALWGDSLRYIWGYNLTRHFPYAAETLRTAVADLGTTTDYVVTLDPSVVAGFLSLTGPVSAEGVVLDSSNVEDYLTNGIYVDFPSGDRKNEVALSLLSALFEQLQQVSVDPGELFAALAEPVGQGRLLMWSADPQVQRRIERSVVGGAIPEDPGPTVTVAINNTGGNKMDYYLDSRVTYEITGQCSADTVEATVRIDLDLDDVPAGLPDYVTVRSDLPPGQGVYGSTSAMVHTYLPAGSALTSFTVDGVERGQIRGVERNHAVFGTGVELLPGAPVRIEIGLEQPAYPGQPAQVLAQPMVRDTAVDLIDRRDCIGR